MATQRSYRSLLVMGMAGLVFAAGAQAQRNTAELAAAPGALAKSMREAVAATRGTDPRIIDFVPGNKQPAGTLTRASATRVAHATDRFFVKLKQPSVVQHLAQARAIRGDHQPLSLQSAAASSHEALLVSEQQAALASFRSLLGRNVVPKLSYTKALNGFSIQMSAQEAEQLAKHDAVASVRPIMDELLHTDAGPALIGAPGIWDGSATGGTGTLGAGITVGIIDSGINSNHPSFAATAGTYTHVNPYGAGQFQGWCATPANAGFCNDKLVGAYDFVYDLVAGDPTISEEASPEDNNSHGSHTAGTVAGNPLVATFNNIPGIELSGVAPRANIIAYDACYTLIATGQGLCPQDATAASVEQAIEDGEVSVINYSIGGGVDPYNDVVSEAFLAATEMGIYVAASAGNDGPDPATLGHQEPWVATTAASTHGRGFGGDVSITGPGTPPANVVGLVYVASSGVAVSAPIERQLLDVADITPANAQGCNAYTGTPFANRIALIPRGGCDFTVKVNNARTAGAAAVVVYNNVPGAAIVMGGLENPAITTPAVMIQQSAGLALAAYSDANPTATLRIGPKGSAITGTVDMMADFSSRGPNSTLDVLKPDLTAPGVDVMAPVADGDGQGVPGTELGLISGTSMSSPHHAGAVALLQSLRPTWTPMQIKSALMLTAKTAGMVKEDGTTPADPFDLGNGRIQLEQAANAGLVMDETIAAFEAANPAEGGDVRALNLASLYSSNCIGTANCVFERRFTNPGTTATTWDITFEQPEDVIITAQPSSITVAPGATATVTFTADADALAADAGFVFGSVILTETAGSFDPLHLNVAIQGSSGVLPDAVTVQAARDAGSVVIEDLVLPEVTDLTFVPSGLVRGTTVVESLAQDSNNGSPFDNLNDGVWYTVVEPGGFGVRFVAEILASQAADLDLFVGIDVNGDGRPQQNELIGSSATATALERVDLYNLPSDRNFWILVQNWQGSGNGPDEFTLSYAFVAYDDAGNLAVTAPATPAAGVPFDAVLSYNEPQMSAGERWYGALDVGTSPAGAQEPDIGTVGVDVIRGTDDVVKTANVETAAPGDTITYTITVAPNTSAEDLAYTIADTLPAGLTLVPGSAQASNGTVTESGNTVNWTVTQLPAGMEYVVSNSATDASCAVPLANHGAYTDLAAFGITSNPNINGEGPFQLALAGGGMPYYGGARLPMLYFSPNGAMSFDVPSIMAIASGNGANLSIPNATVPNALLAPLWTDLILDRAQGGGVSLANLTDANDVPIANILEFDGLLLASDASGNSSIDLQVYVSALVLAGEPELVFAYANPTGAFTSLTQGTIGIENVAGTDGVQVAYNDANLQVGDGYAICFDLQPAAAGGATLTYQATVDAFTGAARTLTNTAVHDNDADGTSPEASSWSVVAGAAASADLAVAIDAPATAVAGGQIVYTIDVSNGSADAASDVAVSVTLPAGLSYASVDGTDWTCTDGATVECAFAGPLSGNASTTLDLTVDIAADVLGDVTTSVTVGTSTTDPETGNNTATVTTTVQARPDAIFGDGFED